MEDIQTKVIHQIVSKIKGIGESTAGHIASDFDSNLEDFLNANISRLSEIKKSNGKQLLSIEQIGDIIQFNQLLPKNNEPRAIEIYLISMEFLESQFTTLEKMNLDSLDINPFIVKALDFTEPRQVIEFNCFQSITRSVVTSWGMTVEKILKASGADDFKETKFGSLPGDKPDITKTIRGIKHYIQVKSGPNTMNISMVNSLNDVIEKIATVEPESKTLLGMTYGRKHRVSSQIKGTLTDYENNSLIGREFWNLIGEKDNYHREILKILDESSKAITTKSYIDLLYGKIDKILEEWNERYAGRSIDEVMEDYV